MELLSLLFFLFFFFFLYSLFGYASTLSFLPHHLFSFLTIYFISYFCDILFFEFRHFLL
ncbi:uncharacterized protein BX664DRAFT_333004, partial [Halteromyces radiatus]|uniref:uncharacterized protein n=1 Tax=Halteromyces radiatus TaxID=101107 RepID=UPI00221E45F6